MILTVRLVGVTWLSHIHGCMKKMHSCHVMLVTHRTHTHTQMYKKDAHAMPHCSHITHTDAWITHAHTVPPCSMYGLSCCRTASCHAAAEPPLWMVCVRAVLVAEVNEFVIVFFISIGFYQAICNIVRVYNFKTASLSAKVSEAALTDE